jgi:hypothetical protein
MANKDPKPPRPEEPVDDPETQESEDVLAPDSEEEPTSDHGADEPFLDLDDDLEPTLDLPRRNTPGQKKRPDRPAKR